MMRRMLFVALMGVFLLNCSSGSISSIDSLKNQNAIRCNSVNFPSGCPNGYSCGDDGITCWASQCREDMEGFAASNDCPKDGDYYCIFGECVNVTNCQHDASVCMGSNRCNGNICVPKDCPNGNGDCWSNEECKKGVCIPRCGVKDQPCCQGDTPCLLTGLSCDEPSGTCVAKRPCPDGPINCAVGEICIRFYDENADYCTSGCQLGYDGYINCNGLCTNIRFDQDNCGGCGKVCDANQICNYGGCMVVATGTDSCDKDGDGYLDVACGGTDCDDNDPAINPGTQEICGDGIDNDCDGIPDEGCNDCTPTTCEAIGRACGYWTDGCWGDLFCGDCPMFQKCSADGTHCDSCDQDLDGYLDVACGGTDCNDSDPAIHPGAHEICYDSIDSDCDGNSDKDCDNCTPETCEEIGRVCGYWTDGCWGDLFCGDCPANQQCSPDGTQCLDASCGQAFDTCASPEDCCDGNACCSCSNCSDGSQKLCASAVYDCDFICHNC